MEITFEQTPWEQALSCMQPGDTMTALRFLTLTEDFSEEELEEALLELEENHISLDLQDLPKTADDGAAALRLRQEQQLVNRDELMTGLEETDPLRLYLEELAAIPVAGDIRILAEEYLAGKESVAQKLADLSLARCVGLAKEHTGRGVLLLDLIQEASLGLWQGILGFSGGDFESHRDWWIRQYLAKAVVLQARAGGIGQKLRSRMEDYRDVDQRLLGELSRNPTLEEIAEAMHISPQEAAVYADMVSAARMRKKIEASREEPEPSPEDEQAVEDTAYFQMRQRITELLSCLSEEEAKLLTLRFGLEGGVPLSPEEAGRKLGLTPQEVVQTEAKALLKLRKED
jgi:RNA polymerase primary sigma factor